MASTPSSNDNTPGPDTPAEVNEVVRHTDSGSGASQAEHWPPNVAGPDEDGAITPPLPLPIEGREILD